ncbi:hypothetical protein KXX45_005351 [Aspergillus fumigatus]|nr:hypothetical protein KXX45_005351 [Aspergillus fumigatus]KAH1406157.1 hypothetical protein KXX51_008322 [Aspergillus fumigatus]KAH1784613.1 hypothetical protein KXX36_008583 [Aspergillus fumigatus]KAH2488087.1 hypothetical protein KXW70_005896 [Aspergillus fumigatus]KAH3228654.1 hypothetical protein KXV77_000186 [Aspergillus fumigatus]
MQERWNHDASGDSQEQGVPEDKVLDDPARYNFDDGSEDSRRQYRSGQNNEYLVRPAEESEEDWRDVIRA